MSSSLHAVQDEDFVCHTFGIRLDMPGVRDPAAAALAELGLAEERLQALQEQQQAHRPGRAEPPDGPEAEGLVTGQHVAAFLARVRLRKALLKVRSAAAGMHSCPCPDVGATACDTARAAPTGPSAALSCSSS